MVVGAGHNGLVCAAYLAKAGLRTLLVEARSSVGGTASSEAVRRRNGQHLQLRPHHVPHHTGDGRARPRRVRPALHRHRAGATQRGVGWRTVVDHPSRCRADDRLAGTHPSHRGRRLPPLRGGGAARSADGARQRQRSAVGRDIARKVAARRGRGAATLLRWSRRSAADVHARLLPLRGIARAGHGHRADGVGCVTRARRHWPRCADLRHSPRRPRRSAGRRQRHGARSAAPAVRALRRHADAQHQGRPPHLRRRRRSAAWSAPTAPRSPRRSSSRRAIRTTRSWPGCRTRRRKPGRWSNVGGRSPTTTATSRRSMPSSIGCRRSRRPAQPLGATMVISPSLDEIHRGHAMMAQWARSSTVRRCSSTRPRRSTRRSRPTAGTSSASRCSTPRTQSPEAGPTAASRGAGWTRWRRCWHPGFLDSLVEWRAMTPDRYEREFHLPHGHATSFAGGPLAALRNKNPELTRYETAGEGPVPHRCSDVPRGRHLGRQRPQRSAARARHPVSP